MRAFFVELCAVCLFLDALCCFWRFTPFSSQRGTNQSFYCCHGWWRFFRFPSSPHPSRSFLLWFHSVQTLAGEAGTSKQGERETDAQNCGEHEQTINWPATRLLFQYACWCVPLFSSFVLDFSVTQCSSLSNTSCFWSRWALYDFEAAYWEHYSFWSDGAKLMTTHALSPKGGKGSSDESALNTPFVHLLHVLCVFVRIGHKWSIGLSPCPPSVL